MFYQLDQYGWNHLTEALPRITLNTTKNVHTKHIIYFQPIKNEKNQKCLYQKSALRLMH